MTVKTVIRGNFVEFATEFVDANNLIIAGVSNATLSVAYAINGVSQTDVLSMSMLANGYWAASWNSANSDPGVVAWFVYGTNGSSAAATQGTFNVWANPANPSVSIP